MSGGIEEMNEEERIAREKAINKEPDFAFAEDGDEVGTEPLTLNDAKPSQWDALKERTLSDKLAAHTSKMDAIRAVKQAREYYLDKADEALYIVNKFDELLESLE